MKKNVIFMAILFMGLLFSFTQTNAQCTGGATCLPDCPDDPWSPATVTDLYPEPGCTLRVAWSWRIACGQFQDYNIESVQLIGACSYTNVDDVLDAATIALLSLNPKGFQQNCDDDVWRASKAVCWMDDGTGCYTPCPPVQCYLELYRFCNGVLKQISNWVPPVNCTLPCEPVTPLSE